MFRAVFAFTSVIVDQNDLIVRQARADALLAAGRSESDGIVSIGVHLRHSSNKDVNGTDTGETTCLRAVLAASNPLNKTCLILVASDRANSLERMKTLASGLGCSYSTSNHTKVHASYGEHGPFWGEIAMADIELLAHSDLFIG